MIPVSRARPSSTETGAYSFTNVLAGHYDVKVTLQGFKEFVKTGVPVSVNEVSRVNAALEIGGMTETVTVASELQLLQTDKADTHTEITVSSDHAAAAAAEPELPVADQPGAGRDARPPCRTARSTRRAAR